MLSKDTLILCHNCRKAILICVRDLAIGHPIRAEHFRFIEGEGPENGDLMECPECGLEFCDFTMPVVAFGSESVCYTRFYAGVVTRF